MDGCIHSETVTTIKIRYLPTSLKIVLPQTSPFCHYRAVLYKRKTTVCPLFAWSLWLEFEIHPRSCVYQQLVPLDCLEVFYRMDVLVCRCTNHTFLILSFFKEDSETLHSDPEKRWVLPQGQLRYGSCGLGRWAGGKGRPAGLCGQRAAVSPARALASSQSLSRQMLSMSSFTNEETEAPRGSSQPRSLQLVMEVSQHFITTKRKGRLHTDR